MYSALLSLHLRLFFFRISYPTLSRIGSFLCCYVACLIFSPSLRLVAWGVGIFFFAMHLASVPQRLPQLLENTSRQNRKRKMPSKCEKAEEQRAAEKEEEVRCCRIYTGRVKEQNKMCTDNYIQTQKRATQLEVDLHIPIQVVVLECRNVHE